MFSHSCSVSVALDKPRHRFGPVAALRYMRPYFLAEYRFRSSDGGIKSLMLSNEDHLLDFMKQCAKRGHVIFRIGLLSPGYINETGLWQLDDLVSLWEAEESNFAMPAIIYGLSTGVQLVKSFNFTPVEQLGKRKLLASFPVPP